MARISVTAEMADALRELRLQNKIASKEIAVALNRSPSYISKIENGSIKSMSEEEFDIFLKQILPECSTAQERLDKLIEFQVKKYEHDTLEQWIWFQNLDTVYRLIPIPTDLIDEINFLLSEGGISLDDLVERINGNEELLEEERKDDTIICNEWFVSGDSSSRRSIKMFVKREEIDDILNGKTKACNYVTMQAIVHYLFKIKLFPKDHQFTDEDIQRVTDTWLPLLDKHRFYTLSRKEMLLSQARSQEQAHSILNEFDIENQDILKELLRYIKMATDMDVLTANKNLRQFVSNLKWDILFMLRLVGFDFASIEICSFSNKKQMLLEIKEVVKKYQDMPVEQRAIELYTDLD